MSDGWSRLHHWFRNTLWRSSCGRSPSVEMIRFVFHQAPTQHPIQGSADPSGFWETSRALGPAHHHGWSFIRATLPARRLRFRPTAPPPDSQVTGPFLTAVPLFLCRHSCRQVWCCGDGPHLFPTGGEEHGITGSAAGVSRVAHPECDLWGVPGLPQPASVSPQLRVIIRHHVCKNAFNHVKCSTR